ncbi:hypothetical protein ARMGADRAFT_1169300 [Armillaria gallica]|uniref:Uncharacterized protein n=1 Tax=Armillaria gallica TaxID=47427 RepID=A0A2H3DD41_ARMGA|nr:hypothetical protein ARMGADRAFT_1169300 [Armillaria gallica]
MRKSETTFIGLSVYEIKFIPGRQRKWRPTASKGIWSVLTIWGFTRGHKCSEWSVKDAMFTGVMLNADPESEAGVAVSLSQRVVLLHLNNNEFLHEIHSFDTDLRAVCFTSDIIALDDDAPKTLIYNWRTEELVFTLNPILIIRARSTTLYDFTFTRIATHSFGWVDGASVTPKSILIRSQSDNPRANEVSSRCGPLRCTDVILGKRANAVSISPRDPTPVSQWEEHDGLRIREVCMNTLNDWTAFDCDEDLGRFPLRRGLGKSRWNRIAGFARQMGMIVQR